MIIILEGADGVGKTTLAEALVKELEAHYIHATWNRELNSYMLKYQTDILTEAMIKISDTMRPVILDRLWLSEAIYSEVYRYGSQFPHFGILCDVILKSVGGFNILCLAGEGHEKRFDNLKAERKEMYDDVSRVAMLYTQFWEGNAELAKIFHPGYMKDIMSMGGAKLHPRYLKYSIEDEGQNLAKYVQDVKRHLKLSLQEIAYAY